MPVLVLPRGPNLSQRIETLYIFPILIRVLVSERTQLEETTREDAMKILHRDKIEAGVHRRRSALKKRTP